MITSPSSARFILRVAFWVIFLGTIKGIYQGFAQGEAAMGITMTVLLVLFVLLWSYPMIGWDPFEAIMRLKRAMRKK